MNTQTKPMKAACVIWVLVVLLVQSTATAQSDTAHQRDAAASNNSTFNLQDNERNLIVQALSASNNNTVNAAKKLGISEHALMRKIMDYKIAEHNSDKSNTSSAIPAKHLKYVSFDFSKSGPTGANVRCTPNDIEKHCYCSITDTANLPNPAVFKLIPSLTKAEVSTLDLGNVSISCSQSKIGLVTPSAQMILDFAGPWIVKCVYADGTSCASPNNAK